jgi:6,7-dimethyl-8-ribityllumazine synthase
MFIEGKVDKHILLIESRFYPEIADEMAKGAISALTDAGCTYERMQVPGTLEIPSVIRYAIKSMQLFSGGERFDGFVTLGCVIRGETDHYDHVCKESMAGVQRLCIEYAIAVGNGILTVDTEAQALARARVGEGNKGEKAARACIEMIHIKNRFGLMRK